MLLLLYISSMGHLQTDKSTEVVCLQNINIWIVVDIEKFKKLLKDILFNFVMATFQFDIRAYIQSETPSNQPNICETGFVFFISCHGIISLFIFLVNVHRILPNFGAYQHKWESRHNMKWFVLTVKDWVRTPGYVAKISCEWCPDCYFIWYSNIVLKTLLHNAITHQSDTNYIWISFYILPNICSKCFYFHYLQYQTVRDFIHQSNLLCWPTKTNNSTLIGNSKYRFKI